MEKLVLELDYARRLGINGKMDVKNKFLITRHIRDYLMLFISLYDESSTKGVAPIGLEEMPKLISYKI